MRPATFYDVELLERDLEAGSDNWDMVEATEIIEAAWARHPATKILDSLPNILSAASAELGSAPIVQGHVNALLRQLEAIKC